MAASNAGEQDFRRGRAECALQARHEGEIGAGTLRFAGEGDAVLSGALCVLIRCPVRLGLVANGFVNRYEVGFFEVQAGQVELDYEFPKGRTRCIHDSARVARGNLECPIPL